MKITLLVTGKTEEKYLIEGIEKYLNRLKHYIGFDMIVIPDVKNTKNLSEAQQKAKEAEMMLKHISNPDTVILLDEKGKKIYFCTIFKLFEQTDDWKCSAFGICNRWTLWV